MVTHPSWNQEHHQSHPARSNTAHARHQQMTRSLESLDETFVEVHNEVLKGDIADTSLAFVYTSQGPMGPLCVHTLVYVKSDNGRSLTSSAPREFLGSAAEKFTTSGQRIINSAR